MKKNILLLLTFLILISCTDPYTLQTNNYEEALVIEATITNELKHQEIKITKTYRLEETAPTTVTDAVVMVTDNFGNSYEFQEQSDRYVSVNEFQAQPNVQYKLKIITDNGKSYSSTIETLTHVNPIQSVVPTVVTKNDGIRGVDMVVNSYDPTNSSTYYRYEYEETYKVIAPKWVENEGIVTYYPGIVNPPGEMNLALRTTEAKICFSTKKSTDIILTSTNNLIDDRVIFPVRFISNKDYTIANRYSILVKQYVQNLESYTYYKTLKELSGSGSILSQNQPGFFNGNIQCDSDSNEKVIGFFDVSSVSSKRIFFNYEDLFPGEPKPSYPFKCPEITPENEKEYVLKYCFSSNLNPNAPPCYGWDILYDIFYRNKVYYSGATEIGSFITVYPIQCGDCTSFSSNIIPSFWID